MHIVSVYNLWVCQVSCLCWKNVWQQAHFDNALVIWRLSVANFSSCLLHKNIGLDNIKKSFEIAYPRKKIILLTISQFYDTRLWFEIFFYFTYKEIKYGHHSKTDGFPQLCSKSKNGSHHDIDDRIIALPKIEAITPLLFSSLTPPPNPFKKFSRGSALVSKTLRTTVSGSHWLFRLSAAERHGSCLKLSFKCFQPTA